MSVVAEPTMQDLSAQIGEPSLRRLYDYWMRQRGVRPMPARCDIDPLDFSYILGNVMLVDVIRNPLRFRVRLHGTEMVRRAGYDLTGRLLDELPDSEYRYYVIERCKSLVETGAPTVAHHDRFIDGRIWRYEALWLPFSDGGKEITMLLCGLIYQDRLRYQALALARGESKNTSL